MSRQRPLFVLLLVLLLASACGLVGSDDDDYSSATGSWRGEATVEGTTYTIDLDLQQPSSTDVTGNGTVATSEESFPFTANGSLRQMALTLSVTYQTMRPASFTGEVSDDFERIEGTWTGPPLGQQRIAFERP